MREIIKRIIGYYCHHRQVRNWKHEASNEAEKIIVNTRLQQFFDGRCLILIPHSDDEWIGCSRIISGNNEVVLCNMDMDGGDTPQIHKERYAELNEVANKYGRMLITIKENKTDELKCAIQKYNPDYIFLPHYIDWHPDHIKVMKILYDAICNLGQLDCHVVMYQVSCPIVHGITHAIPLNKDQWVQKWDFFKCNYKTQLKIPYKRFSLNEVINGNYIQAYASEIFCEVNDVEWMKIIRDNLPTDEQIAGLKSCLGSITKMRNYIRDEIVGNSNFNLSSFCNI